MKFGTGVKNNRGYIWIEYNGKKIWFYHDFDSAAVSDIVDDAIIAGMDSRIKKIRSEAYNRGRRSVRQKDLKISEFSGCVNSDWIGYE